MDRKIPFVTMQATGNRFLLLESVFKHSLRLHEIATIVQKLSSPSEGFGTDGLVSVLREGSAYRMVMYNADGSEAENCGNALLCLGYHLARVRQDAEGSSYVVHTSSGVKTVRFLEGGRGHASLEVVMGKPQFAEVPSKQFRGKDREAVTIAGRQYHYVSMGNPHAVCFVQEFDFDWKADGQRVENTLKIFPQKTNVEYVRLDKKGDLHVRVWERGCGETLGCGTGACAVYALSVALNKIPMQPACVRLKGGDMIIAYDRKKDIRMRGTASLISKGAICGNDAAFFKACPLH